MLVRAPLRIHRASGRACGRYSYPHGVCVLEAVWENSPKALGLGLPAALSQAPLGVISEPLYPDPCLRPHHWLRLHAAADPYPIPICLPLLVGLPMESMLGRCLPWREGGWGHQGQSCQFPAGTRCPICIPTRATVLLVCPTALALLLLSACRALLAPWSSHPTHSDNSLFPTWVRSVVSPCHK